MSDVDRLAPFRSTPAADLPEIDAALARHGLRARRIGELSPPDPVKRGRSAAWIELDDGRTIKARVLESAGAARLLHERRRALNAAFPPALGHAGRVLLEEWIAGAPLAEPEAWIEPAARLLAQLHASPLPGPAATVATGRWRDEATRNLARLAEAGVLAAGPHERLAARLADADPGRVSLVLAHRDFCPENMVVDAAGDLRVIDNEWLEPQPAGIDLARTRSRWPMPAGSWRRFLDAYRGCAPADPGPLGFWEIVVLAGTARVRLRRSAAHAATALAGLCALGADGR
ncbi:MAG: phosphotransferase [Deltaproteobacteria bacterium]|nr:phosphotransferase [Deltaproteobacteria bacterium]